MNDNRATRRRRAELVDTLTARGIVSDGAAARALRTVPRHVFLPEVDPVRAYEDDVVVTKTVSGRPVSSCSQPAMVATQLQQSAVRPGDRVLEIGAGTGYNAALLSELVGPDGSVCTIDVDGDIVERARRSLSAAGYPEVTVVHGDGQHAWQDGAPYDRIIATVGVADVPPAWWEQLAPGGRVCVPLAFRGMQRCFGLAEVDGRLMSDSVVACGFIPVRGIGAFIGRTDPWFGGTELYRDPDQRPVTDAAGVMASPRREWWLPEPLRPFDRLDSLELLVAASQPGYRKEVAGTGGRLTGETTGVAAVVDGDSVARLVRSAGAGGVSVGVHAYGPRRGALLSRIREAVLTWDRFYRRAEYSPIAVLTRKTDAPPAARVVIEKRYTWLSFGRGRPKRRSL